MSDNFEVTGEVPEVSMRTIYEGMGIQELTDHILGLGEQATHIEQQMDLAADVLENGYGVTVEQVLSDRERPQGEIDGEFLRGFDYGDVFRRNTDA